MGFCTEQCLWLFWRHRGDMCVIEESDVFGVEAAKFYNVVASFPDIHQSTREYAVDYWVHCRNVEKQSGRKISDLPPREMARSAFRSRPSKQKSMEIVSGGD